MRLACVLVTLVGVAGMAGCGGSQATTSATAPAAASVVATSASATSASTPAPATAPAAASHPPATSAAPKSQPEHGETETSKAHLSQTLVSLAHAKPAPKLKRTRLSKLPVDDILLSSPAFHQAHGSTYTIAGEYTCTGADRSPPLQWRDIPVDMAELALLVISAAPVRGELFFDWAVAGLSPRLRGLQSGRLPRGAIVGRNSYGNNAYSICPPGSKTENYVFALYALPTSLSPRQGFDPAALREQALRTARHSGLLVGSSARG